MIAAMFFYELCHAADIAHYIPWHLGIIQDNVFIMFLDMSPQWRMMFSLYFLTCWHIKVDVFIIFLFMSPQLRMMFSLYFLPVGTMKGYMLIISFAISTHWRIICSLYSLTCRLTEWWCGQHRDWWHFFSPVTWQTPSPVVWPGLAGDRTINHFPPERLVQWPLSYLWLPPLQNTG